MALTREEILKAKDLKTEEVNVPEWGGTVLVKGLDGRARDAYESSLWIMDPDGKDGRVNLENRRAKLVSLGCVDEKGKPLFTLEDAEALGQKHGLALARISEVVKRLSGMVDGDVEEALGNSGGGQNGDFISG